MQTRDYVESSLSLLGGVCLGAGLMYLFDPALGDRRRRQLSRSVGHMAHSASDAVSSTAHNISDRAGRLSQRAGERFSDYRERLSDYGSDLPEKLGVTSAIGGGLLSRFRSQPRSFRDLYDEMRGTSSFGMGYRAGKAAGKVSGKLGGTRYRSGRRSSSSSASALSLALTAAGALCLGAGLMFILDPQQGRRRRALARDKVIGASHSTSDSLRKTSRYVSDHARGFVAETRARFTEGQVSDRRLVERVRAHIGRSVSNPSAIEVCADQGRIILSGPILASEMDNLISEAKSVRGVKDVENRLEVHATAGATPGLQGTTP